MLKNGILSTLTGALLCLNACNSTTSVDNKVIAADSVSIAKGQTAFVQNCSGCHNFRQDGIGPQLGGLTAQVPAEWIKKFIKDPKGIIASGDERARKLFAKYNSEMPSFAHYSDEELNSIVAFLHTQEAPEQTGTAEEPDALQNPVPEPIALSDMVLGLQPIAQMPPSSEEMPRTRITKLDFQPGMNSLFILDLRGKLYKLQDNQPLVYLDMAKVKPQFINKPGLATGFGSFAFHPEFATNGIFYTSHTEPPGAGKADFAFADSIKVTLQWVLTEWKTEKPDVFPFSGKSRELFRVNMVTGIHGMQEIAFNPLAKRGDEDYALLYIGVGDGGSVEAGYPFLVQSTEMIWGTILRIDPRGKNSANGQYGIPPTNPFVKGASPRMLGEIYAYGFRNPHRTTWRKSGEMLTSNIGQHNIESLNLILPGHNYGWPTREGTFLLKPMVNMRKVYPLPHDDAICNITYPVVQYDHDEGNAISAGYEYWGSSIPELMGKCVFGDIVKGRLFYVDMKDLKLGKQALIKEWQISVNGTTKTLTDLCGSKRVDLRFGRDHRGELYLLTKPDGKVYKLVQGTKIDAHSVSLK